MINTINTIFCRRGFRRNPAIYIQYIWKLFLVPFTTLVWCWVSKLSVSPSVFLDCTMDIFVGCGYASVFFLFTNTEMRPFKWDVLPRRDQLPLTRKWVHAQKFACKICHKLIYFSFICNVLFSHYHWYHSEIVAVATHILSIASGPYPRVFVPIVLLFCDHLGERSVRTSIIILARF